jgi:hypothetical protein
MGLAAREIRGYLSHASADNLNNLASTGGSSNGVAKAAPAVASNTWVQSGPTVMVNNNNNQNNNKGRKAHNNKATSTACDSESDAEFIEPIYASLSDEMGTMSSLGDAASRSCSVTTAANNDFIFHKGPAQSKKAAAESSEDEVHVKKMQLEPRKHRVRPRYYQSSQLKVLDSSSEDDVKIKPLSDEENNTRKGMYNSNKKRYLNYSI